MNAAPGSGAPLSLEECYHALQRGGDQRAAAEHLLGRRHWIHEAADFDERTGDMLPSPLSDLCARLGLASDFRAAGKDRLFRIVGHAREPLLDILRGLHERLIREHASLPIRAVRELDSASFFALSRRPGRTIREKLADRPYLWAVKRRWTVDGTENRLVKAFCTRVADLLQIRANCIGSHEEPQLDDLRSKIESWLKSTAGKEIGRWQNLPPTNLLLEHRDYRRVWDAWRWILALDDDVQRDHDERLVQWTAMVFWSLVLRLARSPGVRLVEQPCYPDYDQFAIATGRTSTAHQAVVDGLIVTPLSGRSCGIVTKLGTDRNGDGYGFVALTGGGSAFFHSHMFASASDHHGLTVGTALTFKLVEPPDGKLRTASPEVLAPPTGFRVEMDRGSRITLRSPGRANVEIQCELRGGDVQVRFGRRTVAAEMNPMGAAKIAESIMSSVFKARSAAPSTDASAAATATSQLATACVVDLCSLRPRFARDEEHGMLPFRLLWQRWQPEAREPVELDLGSAKAIALGADITSVSILDLLAADPVHSPALLSQAARAFAARLQDALGGETLIYVVPDATDEFALSTLRRSVNAAFRVAEPIPRSIATVFAWQSSAEFTKSGAADRDCVLVLDTVGSTLSATPLHARWNKDLELRVPETKGIYWERSPCAQSGPQGSSGDTALGVLNALDCRFPEDIARLCGLQGLVDEGADLSWQDEAGGWYTAPCNQGPAIETVMRGLRDPWSELADGLDHELGRLAPGARVWILLAGDVFREARRRVPTPSLLQGRKVVHLGYEYEPHQGGIALYRWQERAGEIALWRDHLPELSIRINMDGRQARFYLVKDTTVAPKRGRAVPIEIRETFMLPAGMPDYQFPLLQGSEGSELRHEAYLKSRSFPLQDDLAVRLGLTYSYGKDTPYDLVFTPLNPNHSGMKSVRVEWRPVELPSHFPTMPIRDTWSKFERYPKRDSEETSNLLTWVRTNLKQARARTEALRREQAFGIVASHPKQDGAGKAFLWVNCSGDRVLCYAEDFVDPADFDGVGVDDRVWLDISNDGRGLRGGWVTASCGSEAETSDDRIVVLKMEDFLWWMRKGPRFPFLTVWSGGHSLVESDVPHAFREVMLAGTETLLAVLEQRPRTGWSARWTKTVHDLSDEALFLLCCMHKDAPKQVADALESELSGGRGLLERLRRYYRHVALALGGAELDWQRSLLGRVISLLKQEPAQLDICSVALCILGIAVWRCEKLLAELTLADLRVLVDRLALVLQEDLTSLTDDRAVIREELLKDHLELVLGLLRTRASEDQAVRGLLAPRSPRAEKLARIVEGIVDVVASKNIQIGSRLTLNVEKPKTLNRTPDLLFALKLYLTGDAGARAIQIMEVREDGE